MKKMNFKELNKLKDLINNLVEFINDLDGDLKKKEALIIVREWFKIKEAKNEKD